MLPTRVSEGDDHYRALRVAPSATTQEIHAAWRFLLVAFHPDRFRDPAQRERAEEITKRANAAWLVLGDPERRRRYDRRRDGVPPGPVPPPAVMRELPCPSCATRSRVPDPGGAVVRIACPACRETFSAMIGARCVGRPRLLKGWLGLRYEAVFAARDGTRTAVSFRRLPQELALAEGETMSVVFHPRRARPVYAIVHGDDLDVGWRVR
jgi:hypothetical protein